MCTHTASVGAELITVSADPDPFPNLTTSALLDMNMPRFPEVFSGPISHNVALVAILGINTHASTVKSLVPMAKVLLLG